MSTSNVLIATSTGRANSHLAMQDRKSELSSFWEILLIQLWVHFFTFPLLLSVSFRPGVKRTKKQQGRSDRIFFWWCTLCSCVCVSVFDLDEEVRGGGINWLDPDPRVSGFLQKSALSHRFSHSGQPRAAKVWWDFADAASERSGLRDEVCLCKQHLARWRL